MDGQIGKEREGERRRREGGERERWMEKEERRR